MKVRPIASADRNEWLRLLEGLHPELCQADHVPSIDAYLCGTAIEELIPSAVFVAERSDGQLAGFLELSVRNYAEGCRGSTPYVESWYVDEDVRGTGVGRALMEAAEQWARDRGYIELASDALLENSLSHAAHQALGFEAVERIVVFRKPLLP
jgi:aminoglycoside 6'-N-acetyltransferase I